MTRRRVALSRAAAAALVAWIAGCHTPGWTSRGSMPADLSSLPGRTGTARLEIRPSFGANRAAQALDSGAIAIGAVKVSGPDIATPLGATMSLHAGAAASFSIDVPHGPNRVVEVRGLTAAGLEVSPRAVIRAVASVPDDSAIQVNPETTVAADVVLALRDARSPLERTVDRAALGSLVARLVRPSQAAAQGGVSGTAWETYPALVDSGAIATEILGGGSVPEPRSGMVRQGAWLTGKITGLLFGRRARVWADDPASLPVETGQDGSYTVGPLLPGVPVRLHVRSPFYEATASAVAAIDGGATRSVDVAIGGNYIHRRLLGNGCNQTGTVARWTQLPIRVLAVLPPASKAAEIGFRDEHPQAIVDAARVLEAEFPGTLSFQVDSAHEDDADIKDRIRRSDVYVRWYGQLKTGCSVPTVGCVLFYPENGILSGGCEFDPVVRNRALQVRIRLATRHHADGHTLDHRGVRRVALHELVHALGLDHSPDTRDVMYESTLAYFAHNVTLSARDRNTIAFLYSLPANFTRDHAEYDLIPVVQNDGTPIDP